MTGKIQDQHYVIRQQLHLTFYRISNSKLLRRSRSAGIDEGLITPLLLPLQSLHPLYTEHTGLRNPNRR